MRGDVGGRRLGIKTEQPNVRESARIWRKPMSSATATQSDFQRGVMDGRNSRSLNEPIPPLAGGAYAVGFLCGYQGERRRHAP
jgi:hypothetical protein